LKFQAIAEKKILKIPGDTFSRTLYIPFCTISDSTEPRGLHSTRYKPTKLYNKIINSFGLVNAARVCKKIGSFSGENN